MDYTTISIDLEVYKLIQTNLNSFEETPNDVLRRLLKLNNIEKDEENQLKTNERISKETETQPTHTYINWKGVNFRNGLKLRKIYKGVKIEAEVKNGKFYCKGKYFDSPSAAGAYATNGTSVNGWIFWEYYDVLSNNWKLLDNLRNK